MIVRKVRFSPNGRFFATANDDRSLRVFETSTLAEHARFDERDDVNTVAWLDDDTLVFQTDGWLGTVKNMPGAKATRVPAGGAEVQVCRIDGEVRIVAASKRHQGLGIFDTSLRCLRRFSFDDVARVRLSADGQTLMVASWTKGLFALALGTGRARQVCGGELFGLEADGAGGFWCGGKRGALVHVGADGQVSSSTPTPTSSWGPPVGHPGAVTQIRRAAGADAGAVGVIAGTRPSAGSSSTATPAFETRSAEPTSPAFGSEIATATHKEQACSGNVSFSRYSAAMVSRPTVRITLPQLKCGTGSGAILIIKESHFK